MKHQKPTAALLAAFGCLLGQDPREAGLPVAATPMNEYPVYRQSATKRTITAINYSHRAGATKIDFKGTGLLPLGRGEAKVESKKGYIEVEVEFDGLKPAWTLGGEYLTYVLWAVSPTGRTANLGELLLSGARARLDVTTELQAFALLVTAEPYYAVRQPSNLVVLENVAREDTKGKVELVDVRFELLHRGQNGRFSNPLVLQLDRKLPLELYEARNAVHIARGSGADRLAPGPFGKAEKSLAAAEAAQARKADRKSVSMSAREAVQAAGDSLAIAVKQQEADLLAARHERSTGQAVNAGIALDNARAETKRIRQDAEVAGQRAEEAAVVASIESARQRSDGEVRARVAEIELDRVRSERDALLKAARTGTDVTNRDAGASTAASGAGTPPPGQISSGQEDARRELLRELNAVLPSRDTPRGLIANVQDSLFDNGTGMLGPLGREHLAKLARIVSAQSGLTFEVEGHTSARDGEEPGNMLSQSRADEVRNFLTQSGIPAGAISSKGFGEARPIVSNSTAEGRQQNRRVEVVISGGAIGAVMPAPAVR